MGSPPPRSAARFVRPRKLLLIQDLQGLQNHTADDLQALRTQLVERVLRRVPKHVSVTVVEIDQIGAGHAPAHKGQVVIIYLDCASVEMGLVSQSGGRLIDNILKPW